MNKYSVCAWLDDLQMSAQLAKLANLHSYDLKFFGDDLNNMLNYPKTELLIIIGYLQQLAISQVKFSKEYGCHMVIGSKDLLKFLNSILKKNISWLLNQF